VTKKAWARPSAQGTVPDRPVRVVTTRSQRYTGRGRDWAKKAITKRAAQRVAKYYAGRLLADAVRDGWAPADLVAAYGKDGLETVREALLEVSWRLESTGDPKGRPCPTLGRPKGS
jgi:hypothetical protein